MSIRIDTVVIHTGELCLKGGNRGMFERTLADTVRARLAPIGSFKLAREQGSLVATAAEPLTPIQIAAVRTALQRTFGVGTFLFGARTERTLDAITSVATELLAAEVANGRTTFKVFGKRSDKRFPMNSQEVAVEIGGRLLDAVPGSRVDVNDPQTSVRVEIGNDDALVAVNRETGPGGLPTGTAGKVVALLSGGIDSPVAAWKLMSRGCECVLVHFHSYPHVDRASVDKARRLAETLATWQGKTILKLVPLAGIQREIVAKCDPSMRVVLYRRAMLRLAERIAADPNADGKSKNMALALVTGDAVGQVASQTLENIAAVSAASTMPIFRPLAGDDKDTIVTLARRVGTYDISIEPHEDCCSVFMPPRAATRSTAAQAASEEAKCDLAPLMEAALAETETIEINPFQARTAAAKAAAK